MITDPDDTTLASYEAAADSYIEQTTAQAPVLLAITLKEGDGEGWSTARLGLPRHFTYWREPALRQALDDAGWHVTLLAHVPGRSNQWLHVIAQPD